MRLLRLESPRLWLNCGRTSLLLERHSLSVQVKGKGADDGCFGIGNVYAVIGNIIHESYE